MPQFDAVEITCYDAHPSWLGVAVRCYVRLPFSHAERLPTVPARHSAPGGANRCLAGSASVPAERR